MNRRTFTKSLAALFAVPALPAIPMAAPAAVVQVPTQARFWAIVMARMNGRCTPLMIQTALNVSKAEAERYLAQLVKEGVIYPQNILPHQPKPEIHAETQSNTVIRRVGVIVIDNMARMSVGRAVGFA